MAVRIKKTEPPLPANTLTDKERRMLIALANGLTVINASKSIGYSKSSGEKLLQSARERFSTHTTYSLLAKAVKLGLLE